MCTLIENYAEEYAEERVIQEAIEMCEHFNCSKEDTIAILIEKHGLDAKQADEYYNMFAPQSN